MAHAQSDTTRPVIAYSTPPGTAQLTGLPETLRGTFTDSSGPYAMSVTLIRNYGGLWQSWNGSVWGTEHLAWVVEFAAPDADGTSAWSVSPQWPSGTDLPRGAYFIHGKAFDNAGNRADLRCQVSIGTSDDVAPIVAITSPANQSLLDVVVDPLTEINGTIRDQSDDANDGSGVTGVLVLLSRNWHQRIEYWNGEGWTSYAYLPATLSAPDAAGTRGWSLSENLPGAAQLETGTYSIGVMGFDAYGNRGTTSHVLNIAPRDVVPPVVGIEFPAQNQAISRLSEIRGSAFDGGSGMARVLVDVSRTVAGDDGIPVTQYWNGSSWSESFSRAGWLPNVAETGWTRSQNLPAGDDLPAGQYSVMAIGVDRYHNTARLVRDFTVVEPLPLDAMIGNGTTANVGKDVVSPDPAVQSVRQIGEAEATQSFAVRVVKSGGSEDVTLTAAEAPNGWSIYYFDANNQNITEAITGAGWTQLLFDGEVADVRIEVTPPADASAGSERVIDIRARVINPDGSALYEDSVRAIAAIEAAPTPDLSIRTGNAWKGEGVFNTTGADQTLQRVVKPGQTVRGEIKLAVSDAVEGQSVRWSVPDLNGFVAEGWELRFFDQASQGNDITDQVSGGIWTTQYAPGQEPVIAVEARVPGDASDVTRVLSVRAQIEDGAADVVKLEIEVLPNVPPDVEISRLVRGQAGILVGQNQYTPQLQRLSLVAAVEDTEKFVVKVTNRTSATARFLFEKPLLPAGWSYKLYDSLQEGALIEGENGDIVTPPLEPYQSLQWRLEITTTIESEPQVFVPVTFSSGSSVDSCQIMLQMQGIAGAEYTLDGGATWTRVEGTVLTVPQGSTLGFNALPLYQDSPWPNDPFQPHWFDRDEIYYGELVFLYYPTPTPEGEAGDTATVTCGNEFSVQVKVKSEEDDETP